jgi:hypothetical protein
MGDRGARPSAEAQAGSSRMAPEVEGAGPQSIGSGSSWSSEPVPSRRATRPTVLAVHPTVATASPGAAPGVATRRTRELQCQGPDSPTMGRPPRPTASAEARRASEAPSRSTSPDGRLRGSAPRRKSSGRNGPVLHERFRGSAPRRTQHPAEAPNPRHALPRKRAAANTAPCRRTQPSTSASAEAAGRSVPEGAAGTCGRRSGAGRGGAGRGGAGRGGAGSTAGRRWPGRIPRS